MLKGELSSACPSSPGTTLLYMKQAQATVSVRTGSQLNLLPSQIDAFATAASAQGEVSA
jgi:hypothetical protein